MNKKNILVIEDEKHIIELVREVLGEHYTVIEADTGEKGIEMALSNKVEAVVLDIKLPGINGWEVLQEFRQDKTISELPVIILTAVSKMELEHRSGDYTLIKKPFDPVELLETVNKVTENKDE
ncbi:MAG: response regulator [Elusimicrobiota bacterium]